MQKSIGVTYLDSIPISSNSSRPGKADLSTALMLCRGNLPCYRWHKEKEIILTFMKLYNDLYNLILVTDCWNAVMCVGVQVWVTKCSTHAICHVSKEQERVPQHVVVPQWLRRYYYGFSHRVILHYLIFYIQTLVVNWK